MSEADLGAWLERLGLGQYRDTFIRQEIDLNLLPRLTDSDLQLLGIPLGARYKILDAAKLLRPKARGRRTRRKGEAAGSSGSGLQRRNLTMMVCDMVRSTVIASRLDPEEWRGLLDSYLEAIGSAVRRFDGHVARYQGDGVLAYFGFPHAHEDAAERAVRSALAMLDAIRGIAVPSTIQLRTRIGIATGVAIVGELELAGTSRVDPAVGEIPARASRLEQIAPPDGILISATTRDLLGRTFELEALGRRELRGFPQPEPVWRVLGETKAETRFEARGGHRTGIIGRGAEMARLTALWAEVAAGRSRAALIVGEPGLGKSHLVRRFADSMSDGRPDIVFMQCSPYHQNSALYPVISWLEHLAGFTASDPDEQKRSRLQRVLGDMGVARGDFDELLSLPAWLAQTSPSSDVEALARKERALSALSGLFTGMVVSDGRLLVLEDGHWSDATTLELFRRIIGHASASQLFVIVTTRPDFVATWQDSDRLEAVRLNRLDRSEAERLVHLLDAAEILSPDMRRMILDKADGVPLFLEELTKAVAEDVGESTAIPRERPSIAVPPTLQDTLMARLDRLASCKVIAQTGAAIGRDFSYRSLAACSGLPPRRLREGLTRLVDAELISCEGIPPNAVYSFGHALIRDAAYDSMLRSRRTELHDRIARVLEEQSGPAGVPAPEVLAYHYTEAGKPDEAITWWGKAAGQAIARSANVEARNNLLRALALLEQLPASRARDEREMDLRLKLAGPLLATTGFTSSATDQNYKRISELTATDLASETSMYVLWGLAASHLMRSELDAAEALGQRYMQHPGVPRKTNAPSVGYHLLAYARWVRGDLMGAQSLWESALSNFDMQSDRFVFRDFPMDMLSSLACSWSAMLRQRGEVDRAIELQDMALQEAIRTGRPPSQAFVLFHLALGGMVTGDIGVTQQFVALLFDVIEQHNVVYWRWHAEALAGWAEAKSGKVDAGIARIHTGLSLRHNHRAALWVPVYLAGLAEVHLDDGRTADCLDALAECERAMADLRQHYAEPQVHRLRARALEALGEPDDRVDSCLDRALDSATQRGARVYRLQVGMERARRLAERGNTEAAYALLAPICAEFPVGEGAPDLARARNMLPRFQAVRLPAPP